MTIHWIRHGATTVSGTHCVGHENVELSDTGRQSIRQLGTTWNGPPPDRIVSSDLKRARGSAGMLATRWELTVNTTKRLRELDFGDWTGQRWDAIQAEDETRLQHWMENWVETAPPNGESFKALSNRLVGWLGEVQRTEDEDATLVVVAHAGPIRAVFCHALDMPMERAFCLQIDCASVSTLTSGMKGWTAACLNAAQFRRP